MKKKSIGVWLNNKSYMPRPQDLSEGDIKNNSQVKVPSRRALRETYWLNSRKIHGGSTRSAGE